MKKLYLWNDLNLFFNSNALDGINVAMEAFANRTQGCTLIGAEEFPSWAKNIKRQDGEKGFLVGTRPNRLTLPNLEGFTPLCPRRVHQTTGTTATVTLPDEQRADLIHGLSDHTEICIVEDVVVGGKTMESLCEIVKSYGPSKKTRFQFFVANQESLQTLVSRYSDVAEFESHYLMEGRPIEESTLICLYDLLFNNLGDHPFRDRYDLLGRFFHNLQDLNHLVVHCRGQLAKET